MFIDTLLTITANIPKIKNFISQIININGNKIKLLRKYISNLNKEICEFNSIFDNHCDSCAKSTKQISKMFFSLMETISKKIGKYNKIIK
jgi:hypothetical protein